MSSLLGNIFSLADKTKAGVKSPPTPNTFGEEERPSEICSERWWGGRGLCNRRLCHGGHRAWPGPCQQWAPMLGTHAGHPFCKHTLPDLNPDTQQDLNSLHAASGEERLWAEMWREAARGERTGRGSQPALVVMPPATNLPEFPWIRTPLHTGTPGMSS